MRPIALICGVLLAAVAPATAQPLTAEQKATLLTERWAAVFDQLRSDVGLQMLDADGRPTSNRAAAVRLAGSPDERRIAYEELVRRLMTDPALSRLFELDLMPLDERPSISDQQWVAELAASGAGEKGAASSNAPGSNPAAPQAAERSGFTNLISLALDTKNILSANESAVTINVNALAALGLTSTTRSAPSLYRDHGALRRLGGSFTFGAKIPEGEITGLTGLPSASTILDAIGWDLKVRVYGDRDPRAQRWYNVMLGYMGGLVELAANAVSSPAVLRDDRPIVKNVFNDVVGQALRGVNTRLSKSAQVSVKAAGQHLTKETGKNKYSVALLADKGFGDTDLTMNASYAVVDDVAVAPGSVVTLKTWSAAIALNHLVAHSALVEGRATELSFNAKIDVPVDDPVLAVTRKNVWRLVGKVSLPWGDAATIPVSVTFASDPNSLTKEKFVTGHVGVSYDFGALKSLFKPLGARQ